MIDGVVARRHHMTILILSIAHVVWKIELVQVPSPTARGSNKANFFRHAVLGFGLFQLAQAVAHNLNHWIAQRPLVGN